MIDKNLIPAGGLKKEAFSGSHNGMRYRFQSDEDKTGFTATIYPEPWSFEHTPEEEKETASFPLSEEGVAEAVSWLWNRYEEEHEKWMQAERNCMQIVKQKDFKNDVI